MNNKIFLASPHMSSEGYEMEYIKEAFDTNWIAPLGKNVDEFEKEIAAYVGVKHAAALSAGTAALHLAFKLAGVGQGDIVLSSALTFSATCNPITYEKAIPVFIDSEKDTWNIDPNALEEGLKKYPNAKAVVVANLYGTPAKLEEIKERADKLEAGLVIFNDTLSPSQIRNVQKILNMPVMDRPALILDIFDKRARSAESRLQVELARLNYLKPRLIGMTSALTRQGGASGSMSSKGAGEKKLEQAHRDAERQRNTKK